MLDFATAEEAIAAIYGKYVADEKQDIYQQGADVFFDLTTKRPFYMYRLPNAVQRLPIDELLAQLPGASSAKPPETHDDEVSGRKIAWSKESSHVAVPSKRQEEGKSCCSIQ